MPWQLSRTSECSLTERLIQTKVDGILHTLGYAGTGRLGAYTEYGVHAYIQRRDMAGVESKVSPHWGRCQPTDTRLCTL
jgi:hypothetical protein